MRDGEERKDEILNRIAGAAKKGGKDAGVDPVALIKAYYAHAPLADMAEREPASLAAAALGHWQFGQGRKPGELKIRAFNPSAKSDGWTSDRSIVEMVNDDMPFLVDSVVAQLHQMDMSVDVVIHPILSVTRDARGKADLADAQSGGKPESFIQCRITQQSDKKLAEIAAQLSSVLGEVRAAVEDWRPMLEKVATTINELSSPSGDVGEAREFLRWLRDKHFTFLGYRDYDIRQSGANYQVTLKPGLGVLRETKKSVFQVLRGLNDMPPAIKTFVTSPEPIIIAKANSRSVVHRPVVMDTIVVKRFDDDGRLNGARVFVGLFTSLSYSQSPREIPLIRRKISEVAKRAGFGESSHDGKALAAILENFPRDELFQISADALYNTGIGILDLQDRQRVALFVRRDDFERFISCLVYVPRDRYTTALRLSMQAILEKAFAGKVVGHTSESGDAPLARLNLLVETTPGQIPNYDAVAVEAELAEAARSWADRLQSALIQQKGEAEGSKLADHYKNGFPTAYEERFTARDAMFDIGKLEDIRGGGDVAMDLYRPEGLPSKRFRIKLYLAGREVTLSDILPMLEHMGLRVLSEMPYALRLKWEGVESVMIEDFGVETKDGGNVSLRTLAGKFKECFTGVWRGQVESDGFNALVLKAGLSSREIVVLRAYSRYLRQIALPFSLAYMEETMGRNPGLAKLLVDLFMTLFDPSKPDKGREDRAKAIEQQIVTGLEAVAVADEDRIIRAFLNLIQSTLRTNLFQTATDGGPKQALSFKLDSRKITDMPLPKPWREIFVYSPRIEGIHLRFGSVARGGLRWSDRREDFRTEILGLVKAQQVKNAIIVPVGSKGGFVLKQAPSPSDRDAYQREGVACYKIFISGLLDITDTYAGVGTKVVPPKDVVRRDVDDPYLVVAADKGTATFSDIANGVAQEYGFWLDDAFASGGSVGYDHKKMGITAKGAWENVKRHFREMGVDTQAEDFTVVGVGDMSGDVFGNGMLLSPHIKLIAAFNHMHIFLDPNPDPAATLKERQRMFNLPRSGWNDYDTKVISKGGGVFARSLKEIPLSPEVKAMLGVSQNSMSPNELIKTLLKHPVDLLWFGGIGTYVKASHETNADAGDRANDALRVNGSDVRAKVLGEGANLGVTQRGRIEYALNGGRINQDSIDNSAGVDCSDHEVNIKILTGSVIAGGKLTVPNRNKLLAQMTDEVGGLCLRDNYLQGWAISISQSLGVHQIDNHQRLMKMLERAGELDRNVEYLPDDEGIAERIQQGKGLTRPEIGVLLSYSKNWLYAEALKTSFPDDPALEDELVGYFPAALAKKYPDAVKKHRLRREIIGTVAVNALINRAGETFVSGLIERTGMAPDQILRAASIAKRVFGLDDLWMKIEALDNKVPAAAQTEMMLAIVHLLDWITLWFLRNGKAGLDIGSHVDRFAEGIEKLGAGLKDVLPAHYLEDLKSRAAAFSERGVPEAMAMRVAGLVNMFSAPDIVALAEKRKMPVPAVAKLYFAVGARFRLGRLRAAAERLDARSHWQKLAVAALIEETYAHQLALTDQVITTAAKKGGTPTQAVEAWAGSKKVLVEQTDRLLNDLWAGTISDLSMVAVASRQLRALSS